MREWKRRRQRRGKRNDVQLRELDVSWVARHRCYASLLYLEGSHSVGGLELLVRGVRVHAQHRVVIHLYTCVGAWWGHQREGQNKDVNMDGKGGSDKSMPIAFSKKKHLLGQLLRLGQRPFLRRGRRRRPSGAGAHATGFRLRAAVAAFVPLGLTLLQGKRADQPVRQLRPVAVDAVERLQHARCVVVASGV